MLKYIADASHYSDVIERAKRVNHSLWIGTADIKDLYVKSYNGSEPFLKTISDLIRRGVEVRLLHAKEPGPIFKNDFDKYPLLIKHLEIAKCPRVHFKIMVFDLSMVYIGSANLTGAGLGMKGEHKRNFEAGILTDVQDLVENTIEHFDSVWRGSPCKNCLRKSYCDSPIAQML